MVCNTPSSKYTSAITAAAGPLLPKLKSTLPPPASVTFRLTCASPAAQLPALLFVMHPKPNGTARAGAASARMADRASAPGTNLCCIGGLPPLHVSLWKKRAERDRCERDSVVERFVEARAGRSGLHEAERAALAHLARRFEHGAVGESCERASKTDPLHAQICKLADGEL